MFTLKNLRNVQMMAEQTSRNINFRSGSPLAKLITNIPAEATDVYSLLAAVGNDQQHEATMNVLVNEMIPLLKQRIAFIRNTVSGEVETIMDEIEEETAILPKMFAPVDIKTAKIPDILAGDMLLSYVRRYQDATIETVTPISNAFPRYGSEELIEKMMFVDDQELRKEVLDLVDTTQVSIVDIYNKWFIGTTPVNYPQPNQLVGPSYINFMYTEWAIVFLLAQGFLNNVDANVNLRSEQYNLFMMRLASNTGKYLYNSLPRLKSAMMAGGALLIGVTHVNHVKSLIVNDAEYKARIQAGTITPAAVLGLGMLGRENELKMPHALDTKLVDGAEAEFKSQTAKAQAIVMDRYKANVMVALMRSILSRVESGKFANNEAPQTVMDRCRELMDDYSLLGTDHLYLMVRSVVAKGLFPNSGAFAYFNAMDTYQKQNPNIDPRAAATLAARDVLVEYCVNQIA